MTIVFGRHGETALNVARTLQPADTPLSPRGIAQAEVVARRLASLGLGAIVSSDLPRALQTANCIAAASGAPLGVDPIWRERNFGDWRGRPYDELGCDPLTAAQAPPGGESAAEFGERVARAFAALVQARSRYESPVVVVTHGLVIRELLASQLPAPAATLPLRIGNTSVTIVSERPPHAIHLLHCLRHLDEATREDEQSLSGG